MRARAAAAGARFDAAGLDWNLLRRRVVLAGPCLETAALRACAQRLEVVFPWRVLAGRAALDAVVVDGLDLHLRGRPTAQPASAAPAVALPLPLPRRVTLRDAAFAWTAASGDAEVRSSGVQLVLGADGGGSSLSSRAPIAWRVGQQRGEARLEAAAVAWDGAALRLSELALVAPEGRLRLSELALEDLATQPRLRLALAASLDAAALGARAGRGAAAGTLSLEARGDFPLAAPRFALLARGRGLALPPWSGLALDTEATLDAAGLVLSRSRLSWRGAVLAASGQWATNGGGRLKATLVGLAERALAEGLAAPLRSVVAGSEASLAGALDASWTSPAWDALTAQAWLTRRTRDADAGTARLRAGAGRYRFDVVAPATAPDGPTAAIAGELAQPLRASTLRGTASATLHDLEPWLFALGIGGAARGEAALTAHFDGTLGAPRVAGELDARWSQLAGRTLRCALRAQGRLDAATAQVTLAGTLGAAQVAGEASLASGLLRGRLTLDAPAGLELDATRVGTLRAAFALSGTRASPQVGFEADATRLAAAELTAEAAHWRGAISGTDVATVQGESAFTLRGVRQGDAMWGELTGTAGLASGALALELLAPALASRAALRAELGGARRFTLEGRLRPQLADLLGAAAAASGALAADVTAAGHVAPGAAPELDTARVELHALSGSVRGVRLALQRPAMLAYDQRTMAARDLDLQIGESRLQLAGRLGGDGAEDLRLTAAGSLADTVRALSAVEVIGPVAAQVAGAWSVRLAATGTLDAPQIDGLLELTNARLAWPEREPIEGSLRARVADSRLELQEAVASQAGARVVAQGEVPLHFFARWLPGVLAREPAGQAAGAMVSVSATGVDAARLTGRALPGLTGQLAAEATLFAAEPALAALHGELTLDSSSLAIGGFGLVADGPARIALSPIGLDLLPWRFTGPSSDFTLHGRVAQDAHDLLEGQLEARLDGSVPLDLLRPLLPAAQTGGVIALALRATGPLRGPALQGRGRITDGVLLLRDPRVLVDAVSGTVVFERGRLTLEDVAGRVNGGPATLRGTLAMDGLRAGAGRFELAARGLSFEWPQGFRGEADANVALDVDGPRLVLGGEVRVLRGDYRRNLLISKSAFAAEALARVKGLIEPDLGLFDAMRLDVAVTSARDLLVDTNYGRAGITLDLRSIGTWGRPGLRGRIQVAPGAEVYFGGATYTLERAAIEYRNANAIEPVVSAAAVTYRGGYAVNVQVTGTWGRFRTRLSADPPLSEREITALLLTGNKDAGEATLADAELALGYLSADLLGAAGRSLGLEAVRVERGGGSAEVEFDPTAVATDQNPTTRLTAAVRLSPRLRLVYSQNLEAAGAITWILGFEPAAGLEARAVRDDDGGVALELRRGAGFGARGAGRSGEPPARVSAVRIEGDAVLLEPRLRRVLRLGVGDRFDLAAWAADQRRLERELAALDRLSSRVSARRAEEAGGIALVYEVHAGPRTLIRFEGVAADDELRAAAEAAWQSVPLAAFLGPEAEARVRLVLRRRGYLQARVAAAVEAIGPRVEQLVVRVDRGAHSRRRDVKLVGARRLSRTTLRAALAPLLADGSAWDDPAAVATALRREYWRAGAFAASFEVGAKHFQGASATLPIAIDEGPEVVLGEVRVTGAAGLGEVRVREALRLAPGSRPRAEALEAAFARVEGAYHQAGYAAASLRPELRLDPAAGATATLQLTLDVREGPRQQIARLDVLGREHTSPALVERALRLGPGQPLDADALSAAARRLYATGAFRSVSLAPEAGSEGRDGPVPVRVALEEWPAWRFRYGLQLALPEDDPGADSDAGEGFRLGAVADLTRRHLKGSDASAGVAGRARTDSQAVRSWLSAPRLLGRRLRSSAFLAWKDEPLATEDARESYRSRTTELSFEQRLRTRRGLVLAAGYENEWFRYRPTGPGRDSAQGRFARITLTGSVDRRDDLVEPTRGTFSSANYEWGASRLGSRVRFVIGGLGSFEVPLDLDKAFVQQLAWLPLPGGVVAATAARFEWGTGNALGRSSTASLAVGGPYTVRGHEPLGLDLLDLVGQSGGQSRLLVLNQELRFPLKGIARGGVFIDHSRLVVTDDEGGRERSARTGIGVGLRLRTSVGLLRLDWGYPLDRDAPARRHGLFHLAIGHAF